MVSLMSSARSLTRVLFGVNAIAAWIGYGGQLLVNIFYLVPAAAQPDPNIVGHSDPGWAGSIGRVFDSFSFFTNWSNLIVCITLTMLFLNPERTGRWFNTLRHTGILMITMAGILFHILIAPYYAPESWHALTSLFEHYITPIVTVLVWVAVGPRGTYTFKETFKVFIIPIIYLIYTFTRGAIASVYPYDFFNVVKWGYPSVLTLVAEVIIAGYVVALFYLGVERLRSRGRTVR